MNQVGDLSRSITVLHNVVRMVRHQLAKESNLNTSEFDLLVSLHFYDRPMSVKELSKELFLCSQAITKISKHLHGLGLIYTHKSDTDRRVTYMSLTDLGHEIVVRERLVRDAVLQKCLDGITRTNQDCARAVFRQLEEEMPRCAQATLRQPALAAGFERN